jgi:hypothetical protein
MELLLARGPGLWIKLVRQFKKYPEEQSTYLWLQEDLSRHPRHVKGKKALQESH